VSLVPTTNTRSTDRILLLEVMDGQKPLSSMGTVDTRLFTGGQELHLRMDPQTTLWYFQYSQNGLLPEALKGRYTGFKAAIKHAEDYYLRRNVKISQVRD